jgi:hypothetical protein
MADISRVHVSTPFLEALLAAWFYPRKNRLDSGNIPHQDG